MTHPDWQTTHHGRSTPQDYIGNGAPTVPEKCKSAPPEAEPRRCAECDCESGEMECNWMGSAPAPAVPVEGKMGVCRCGLPMTRNPHPDAGILATLCEIGAVWECIPCTARTRHAWAERAQKAEAELAALRAQQPAPQVKALDIRNAVQAGYDAWAAKPHNAKWVRRIDGTPIPNDVVVCIQNAVLSALSGEAQR